MSADPSPKKEPALQRAYRLGLGQETAGLRHGKEANDAGGEELGTAPKMTLEL